MVMPDNLKHADTPRPVAPRAAMRNLKGIERKHISEVLEESGWKIKGEGNAASRLGLKPSTLRSRMKKLEIAKP